MTSAASTQITDTTRSSPFHAGELRAQALAGLASSGAAIRDFMPDQHRIFFAALRFVLLGAVDGDGWPVATVIGGAPGFIDSPDERNLRIRISQTMQDMVLSRLKPGEAVGLLGIDFQTRRRNRANGVVERIDADGLHVAVRQSFGNCPKYINVRDVTAPLGQANGAVAVNRFSGLDAAARAWIAASDTFFIATHSNDSLNGGTDISHRGGAAGFVKIDGDTLICPDYSGNRYFNTLGNLVLEPRASLLFIDFVSGAQLHVSGRIEIAWTAPEIGDFPGAERLWRMRVEGGWRTEASS